jgi:hypothetical protein
MNDPIIGADPQATEGNPAKQRADVLGLNSAGLALFIVILVVFWPLFWLPWLLRPCRGNRVPLPTPLPPRQKTKITISYVFGGVYGLALLPWPFAAFMTAFMFDSPHIQPFYFVVLSLVALSVWLYPVLWLVGFLLGYRSAKRDESIGRVVINSSVPLLSGMWFGVGWPLGLMVLVYSLVGALERRGNQRA